MERLIDDMRARVLEACRTRGGPSTTSSIAMEMGQGFELGKIEACLAGMADEHLLVRTTDLSCRRPRTLWEAAPEAAKDPGYAVKKVSRAVAARRPPAPPEGRPVDLSVNPWLAPNQGIPPALRLAKLRQKRRR